MAPKDPKLELLRSIPLFARLGTRDIERIGELADRVDLPAGRVLMRQGDTGREMFFLVSGRLRVERNGRVLADRGPGDIVGELALLSQGPRTATVTVVEPSALFVLGQREFASLLDASPEIRLLVFDVLVDRLRALTADQAH